MSPSPNTNSAPLWRPSQALVEESNMQRFLKEVNPNFKDYWELYEWSIQNISDFWSTLWDFAEIRYSKPYDQVVDDPSRMPGAKWFSGARLNFAENLLRFRDASTAIIAKREDQEAHYLSYQDLYQAVSQLHQALERHGIGPHDRIAGYLPNIPEAVHAMLACTSLGGVWSSCSPDFGVQAVLDRFGQIEPRILFMSDCFYDKSQSISITERALLLLQGIPSLEKIIIVPYSDQNSAQTSFSSDKILWLSDFLKDTDPQANINFAQLAFEHPIYIMFSSGTTGKPKCIVQGVGVLLNHLKELLLHTNLKKGDHIFYYTTCSWMMWNWLVSGLGAGAAIVLYDGNPLYPHKDSLWQFAQKENISIFGTSARYLALMDFMNLDIKASYKLEALKTILSTGSPLMPRNFEYIYAKIKEDVQLSSISGGTDLNGCFALGCPLLPVHRGELQCVGLGMGVEVRNAKGEAVREEKGELCCAKAFPSMPLFFWKDRDQEKYKKAYFQRFPNVWHHGDYAMLTKNRGLMIFGRSDATLNPGGIRLGSSEIYQQLENWPELEDSLVVEQEWEDTSRIILFVKMAEHNKLTPTLKEAIVKDIAENISRWHIPKKIIAVPEIPYTFNMKKVELSVKNVIHRREVGNQEALVNPQALDYYKNLKELQEP